MRLRVVNRLRLAVFLITLCLVLIMGGWIAGARASAADPDRGGIDPLPQPLTVVASPGDTLWDIATAHAPSNMDPRLAVFVLRQHNSLATACLSIGQQIAIPATWSK